MGVGGHKASLMKSEMVAFKDGPMVVITVINVVATVTIINWSCALNRLFLTRQLLAILVFNGIYSCLVMWGQV